MNWKIYSELLTIGLAASAIARAGTSGAPTPVNVGWVIDVGNPYPDLHYPMSDPPRVEWNFLTAGALATDRAGVDLAMATPGLFLAPAAPTPFFNVTLRFTQGYHRGGTTAVTFTDALK